MPCVYLVLTLFGDIQGYLSNFQMLLALEQDIGIAGSLTTMQDQLVRVCRIAIEAYLSDVRTLVANHLAADELTTPKDKAHPERVWMTTRQNHFNVWKKLEQPLAWGEGTSNPYWLLSRIVYRERGQYGNGLGRSVKDTCSRREFVDKLYTSATATSMQGVRSPLWSRGHAWPVFRTAIAQCLFRLSPAASEREAEEGIKAALESCIRQVGINFYPDLGESREREPSPLAWTLVGLPNSARTRLNEEQPMSHEDRMDLNLNRKVKATRAQDANAPWSAKTTSIDEYHQYVNHETLPVDFDVSTAEGDVQCELTLECYRWAKKFLRDHPQDWRGRLARHLAFLLAKMAPSVFWPTSGSKEVRDALDGWDHRVPEQSISALRKLPWQTREKIKGFGLSLYFSQATVVLLCWTHEQSPLRTHIAANPGTGLAAWNKKHC